MRTSRYMADLSSNQGRVDLDAYRRAGHLVVALKATEGATYVDPTHAARTHAAHRAGLIVWHYHFARPDLHPDPQPEVENFARAAHGRLGPFDRLVLDQEVQGGRGRLADARWLTRFDHLHHQDHLPELDLYTDESMLAYLAPLARLMSGRAWVAAYRNRPPSIPRGWRLIAWQRTDGRVGPPPHRLTGIGPCDVSLLTRRAWLRALRDLHIR